MTDIFGDFIEDLPLRKEYLILGFSPSSIPLKERWRNNGLSADFLADYLKTFFPGQNIPNGMNKQDEIRSSVSYIANELLENAMKFNDEESPYPISIQLHLNNDRIVFVVTNSISPKARNQFQRYIKTLLREEPQELYIRQLEKNAAEKYSTDSRLGFLTMLNDYQTKLGWKFETIQEEPEAIAVSTMVQLMV